MSKSPDIVARLRYGTSQRNHGSLIELCTEAADEIERLKAEIKRLENELYVAVSERNLQAADIALLRATIAWKQ